MRLYPRTPWYWYGGLTLLIVVLSIIMVEFYHTSLPWWAILLGSCIPALYMIPCGIIQGITNVDASQLNVLAEFVGGYLFNGRPLASEHHLSSCPEEPLITRRHDLQDPFNRCRGTRIILRPGYEVGSLHEDSAENPFLRSKNQGSATVRSISALSSTTTDTLQTLGALTQVGVTLWMLGNVSDICSADQTNGFTCPNGRTVFSSSVVWGAIGAARLYSLGEIYSGLLHFF